MEITVMETPVVIENRDWYKSLVDDCLNIIYETKSGIRLGLLAGYHRLGKRIVTDNDLQFNARGNEKRLSGLASDLGMSQRNIYRAVQFYQKFPNLDEVIAIEGITWNQVVTKYLPAPPEEGQDESVYDDIIKYIDLMKEYAKATLEMADAIEYRKTIVSPKQAAFVFDQTALMYGLWDNLKHQLITKTGMER